MQNTMNRLALACALVGAASFSTACGGSSKVTTRLAVAGVTNVMNYSLRSPVDALMELAGTSNPHDRRQAMAMAAGDWGLSTAAQLEELEYYFTSIQLCESVTESGSGYSNTEGCTDIYEGPENSVSYDDYLISQAEAETNANAFIDLKDPASVALMTGERSLSAKTYRYGLVNFMRAFKVKGTVTVGASTTLRTCDGTVSTTGTGLNTQQQVTVADMTSCTLDKQAFQMTNGGNLFRIAGGYTIEDGVDYTVKLAFNPDSFISGTTAVADSGVQNALYSGASGAQGMQFPFIDISPVVHRSSEKAFKMVFTSNDMTLTPDTGGTVVTRGRLELYFAGATSSDSSTAAIQGINFRMIAPTGAKQKYMNVSGSATVNTRTSTTGTTGEIDVLSYDSTPVITGLNRTIAVGASDTADFSYAGASVTGVTWTLTAIEEVL